MSKKLLSVLLALTLAIMPLCGMNLLTASAATFAAPGVTVNIAPFDTVAPNEMITVTYSGAASCDTRLEGTSLGTAATVSFTPASRSLSDGVYTLIMEWTSSAGAVSYESLTFRVDSDAEVYADDAGAVISTFSAEALGFTAGYASSADGTINLQDVQSYGDAAQYALQYSDDVTAAASASGIPYQVFDVALDGKTSGTVTVHYSGQTKRGERMAVKVYNPKTAAWDVIGGFIGEGAVSEQLDIAAYNDNGVIHVAAMLDYTTNGSDTMIWSTDPQHYTKFEDLHEYYYRVYQYAAELYVNGEAGYIITTGDLVDDRPSADVAPHQWDVSDQAMSYVEAVGMPNGLVTGNHDVGDYTLTDYTAGPNTASDYSRFYEHYPVTRYNTFSYYGGSLNNNTSHYDLVTIGNVDFIILYLGYGLEATDETIAWANDVLATYSHRTAIVATHQYLDATLAVRYGRAELIFNKIVDPNPNVKMVICGHDDGSLCLEKTASDGRTVYEVLSDYQFVEAEDPDFYANEHWIGSVPSCCGDGYIRLLTVEGDTLSSITYSPVTGRYNPYGDREMITIDLDSGTPDRTFSTVRFSAAVLGSATAETDVDRVNVMENNGMISYSAVEYATVPTAPAADEAIEWPTTAYGAAATPSNPYYAHAAKQAPIVDYKVDVLAASGTDAHPVVNQWTTFGNNQLNLAIDLTKTPYLYYSFAMPEGDAFTFAFMNHTSYSPWLTFLDATLGGTTLNNGNANWEAYGQNGAQYFRTSATGCIDMRALSTDGANWIINQFNVYNCVGKGTTIAYLFFGSAPSANTVSGTTYGKAATPASPHHLHAAATAPVVENSVDLLSAAGLTANTPVSATASYEMSLSVDLNKTPYLYYSFEVPEGGHFTFALYNNADYAPWLTFLDYEKGGDTMDSGTERWNSRNGAQYHLTSATGCIDMRTLTNDPYGTDWIITWLKLYNYCAVTPVVNYMFFGSEALSSDDSVPMDLAAFTALLAEARAVDTTAYTAASVTVLKNAISRAQVANTSEAAAVMNAYARLSNAMGALEAVKTTLDASSLVSVKNYSLANANWVCNTTGAALTSSSSYLTVTQTDDGMILKTSSAATHNWPHTRYVGSGGTYTVNPYGGVYMKLDVDSGASWAINLHVTQGGGDVKYVRINSGVENSFDNPANDSMEGPVSGVFDVSEAFLAYGVDPTATFTVSGINLFVIGGAGAQVTYNHVELLTGAETAADYSALQSLINYANCHTQSLYTSASWSAMQTALSNAKTKVSTTGLSQPDVNLAKCQLQTALDALVLNKGLESDESLLADDIGIWMPQSDGAAKAYRNADGNTVIENTNGSWAQMTHTLSKAWHVPTYDQCIEIDFTVSSNANPLLLVNGEWFSLSPYITVNRNGEDILAGDYHVKIPLSNIAEFGGKAAVDFEALRVWSVGEVGSNAVTIRLFRVTDYCEHTFDHVSTDYGPAATPSSPYAAYAAKTAPIVAEKVDVLEAIGLDHPVINGLVSYGNSTLRLTVDLEKTPYLYYSFAVPENANFTFAFYNNTDYAPWLTFLDATKGGTTMNQSTENWNAAGGTQYFGGSATGCIDMRTLTNDSSITDWIVSTVSFYNSVGGDATVSYLFFGSEALADGYVEEEVLMGDLDGDGDVDTTDAREILYAVVGLKTLTAKQKDIADLNGDGAVTTADARALLMQIVNS